MSERHRHVNPAADRAGLIDHDPLCVAAVFQATLGAAEAKKPAPERPPPACSHQVAVPPDYDVAAAEKALDPSLHGAWSALGRPGAVGFLSFLACWVLGPRHKSFHPQQPSPHPTLNCRPVLSTPGTIEEPRWEGELAKQYPFVLDPFQSAAIACIERRESVLVAAHTSGAAGQGCVCDPVCSCGRGCAREVATCNPRGTPAM